MYYKLKLLDIMLLYYYINLKIKIVFKIIIIIIFINILIYILKKIVDLLQCDWILNL